MLVRLYLFSLFSAVLLSLTVGVYAATDDMECGTGTACYPWGVGEAKFSCTRGKRINLRFMVDVASESRFTMPNGRVGSKAVYGFCPIVDKLEVFSLKGAQFVASAYNDTARVTQFSDNIDEKYLSVFGFGMSNQREFPDVHKSAGAVLIGVNGSALCGVHRSVAMVHTLFLSIGTHKGMFNYIQDQKQPNTSSVNETSSEGKSYSPSETKSAASAEPLMPEVPVQPAVVGFEPTCNSKDECLFDSKSLCVGPETGKKNCASCYTSTNGLNNASIRIWVSYQGTDDKGKPMRSGGLNPLKFRQFAGNDLFKDIKRTLDDLLIENIRLDSLFVHDV